MRQPTFGTLGRFGRGALAALLLALALAGPASANTWDRPVGQAVHIVQLGETLTGIAARYGVSAAAVAAANGIFNQNFIFAGQRLVIPGGSIPAPGGDWPRPIDPGRGDGIHVVQLGETLYSIAARYGTTVSALLAINNISNPNYIYAGQQLTIPGGPVSPPPGTGRPAPGCGYGYIVKPGDNLSSIAAWHGTTTYALARANALAAPYWIYAGQRLHIPCGAGQPHHPHAKPTPRPRAQPKPDLRPAACAREVQIVGPREQEHVQGTVQIVGTADIASFQFYKVEYAMGHVPLDSAFASINGVFRQKVRDGVLVTWYAGNMPAGAYTLRLTAVDASGNFPRPCDVHMYIDR